MWAPIRYKPVGYDWGMEPAHDGPYIRAAEHERLMAEARNKALEDAAKVAERLRCNTCGVWFHPSEGHTDDDCAGGYTKWDSTGDASEIAAAIRAMKGETDG
jgi:hypothetical protein